MRRRGRAGAPAIAGDPARPRRRHAALSRCRFAAAGLAATLSIAATHPAVALWDHAHGDSANTGFADVTTVPATKPSTVAGKIGTFAPGAGPVIGPDGTVYIGNQQGRLLAFHPDGSAAWHRTSRRAKSASPVVDADGSVYVVGGIRRP